ncbi:trypsin-like peptidase domain-containing protein [Streptomyces sp. NPDC089799]|uniref:S1C family serine protease n=1 Tax=Streptomyces sp. NPDC089799 TaxID=3155066 RepID=UPI00343DDD68
MTESHRREGGYPQENSPSQAAPFGGGTYFADAAGAPAAGAYAYPPRPAHAPYDPPAAPGWYEAHQSPAPQQEPAAADPAYAGPGHAARARRPVGLLVAVALAAAMVGGGTATAVQHLLDRSSASGGGFAGSPISQSSFGTVAGVAEAVSPSVVRIDTRSGSGQGTGSGVVITADGEIVTNNHVISGASRIQVTMSDGKQYDAKVVGTDPDKDLALIKVQGAKGLRPAKLGNSDGLKVGESVVAIGSPDRLTGTVTSGIVSALNREVNVPKSETPQQRPQGDGWPFSFEGRQFNGGTGANTTSYKAIQTDASLNPGNSGGALVNMNGEIVGMPSAIYSPSSDSSTAGSVGLGFAIPVNTIKADLSSLRNGGPGNTGGSGDSGDTGNSPDDNAYGTAF